MKKMSQGKGSVAAVDSGLALGGGGGREEAVAAAAGWALAGGGHRLLADVGSLPRSGQEVWARLVELAREHPYVTSAVVAAVAAGGWAAYEHYIAGPARRRQHQLDKRRRRVRAGTPLALGFQNCPETVEAIELAVKGEIPDWLVGKLFRSGPGTLEVPTQQGYSYLINHWFDGLTMMHGFEIKDGRVFYANRKAAREVEQYIARHGGDFITFGPDPCKSTFDKLSTIFQMQLTAKSETDRDAANIGVTVKRIQGQLYNQTDANLLMPFDSKTLETSGKVVTFERFDKRLKGPFSSAHGQYDAIRKEYLNFVCDVGRQATYTIFAIPDEGETRVLCSFNVPQPSYLHSFALTENYFVLQAWPLYINAPKLLWHKSVVDAMTWCGEENAKFYVVDRNTGELVHVYETPAAFCFHNINAWEEEDGATIVMDLTLYKDNTLINDLLLDRILSDEPSYERGALTRYTLTNVKGTSESSDRKILKTVLYPNTVELPRINVSRHMSPYSYVYGISMPENDSSFLDRIIKFDVSTGEKLVWKADGLYAAEPIFIPSPDATEEDDGVLLSIVLDGATATSFLLVLNAKDLSEIARADVPHHIPFGFHGNFFGNAEETSDMA